MSSVDFDSPAAETYLQILQGIISRMATNSAAAKTWCIALVSAMVVVVADKEKPDFVWISVIPIVLFLFLDSYYLGLEKKFRGFYNSFVQKLHRGEATIQDTFTLAAPEELGAAIKATFLAMRSVSVWPFYGLLTLMLLVVKCWLL